MKKEDANPLAGPIQEQRQPMQQKHIDRPLSALELQRLKSFIKGSPHAMGFHKVIGFMVGLCSAPTIIMPSTWFPVLLGELVFESEEEVQTINSFFLRLYNQINISLIDGLRALPSASLNDEELADWCGGYLDAVDLDDVWKSDKASISPLMPFGVLSGIVSLIGQEGRDGKVIEDDSEYRAQARKALPGWVDEIYEIWTQWRRKQMASQKPITAPKIRRNDPCPCGSGGKFKKCCGR
ncbi:MAG: UPF0149 family protein [bacterium]|nr:UPF0149 family protein [bacterium]